LVERLVENLIDNAIGHNQPDGFIEVTTGGTSITVTNSGPLIPAGEAERLAQPFQRLENDRTHRGRGHGLGLSIVHAIATAHGATVTTTARPEGGLRVEVRFGADLPCSPRGE
jgi:signal transduction histidine kinase